MAISCLWLWLCVLEVYATGFFKLNITMFIHCAAYHSYASNEFFHIIYVYVSNFYIHTWLQYILGNVKWPNIRNADTFRNVNVFNKYMAKRIFTLQIKGGGWILVLVVRWCEIHTKQFIYDEGSHVPISNCERANQFLPWNVWLHCDGELTGENFTQIVEICYCYHTITQTNTHTYFTDWLPQQQLYALFTHWFRHRRSTTFSCRRI